MKIFKKKCVLLEAASRPPGERKLCKFYLHNIIAWYNGYMKSGTFHEDSLSSPIDDTLKCADLTGLLNFDGSTIEPRLGFILSLDQEGTENQLIRDENHWKHEAVHLCEILLMLVSFTIPEYSGIFKANRILSSMLRD